jgi:hypothetical protein
MSSRPLALRARASLACAALSALAPLAYAGDAPGDEGPAPASTEDPAAPPAPVTPVTPPPAPKPTTFRVTVGFPIFPVGVGVEQQIAPHVSVGADATVNFVLALHAHLRVYANPEGRGRFFVQPGFSHLHNPAVRNTSDMLEARIGVDVRTSRTSSFTVDVGAANATGAFASGVFPVGSIAWGTVFGDTRPE